MHTSSFLSCLALLFLGLICLTVREMHTSSFLLAQALLFLGCIFNLPLQQQKGCWKVEVAKASFPSLDIFSSFCIAKGAW